MKIALNLLMLITVFCIVCSFAVPASAAGPADGSVCAGHLGYHGSGILYGRANRQVLPYFAVHPPVYYSHIVARPYGYSPWALPPGMEPAESKVAPQPEMIPNPHCMPNSKPKKSDEKTKQAADQTAGSKMVINPYFAGRPLPMPARLTTTR